MGRFKPFLSHAKGFCMICGAELKSDEVTYCETCSNIMIARIHKYTQEGKKRLDCCMVCGEKLDERHRTACCKACARVVNAMQSKYNRRLKSGIPIDDCKDGEIIYREPKFTEQQKRMAERLGIPVERYVVIAKKRLPIDDDALKAREMGLSYGYYMSRKRIIRQSTRQTEFNFNTALVQMC